MPSPRTWAPRRAGRRRAGGGKEKYSPSLLAGHPWVVRFAQLEGPTAYLGHDFSAVSYVNLTSGRWLYTSLSSPPHLATRVVGEPRGEECDLPVIIHTEDREHALGVISPPRSPPWVPP